MKRNGLVTLVCASVGMLILILDGRTAVAGIQNGIDICLRTLIPSLFPFFVLSSVITGALLGCSIKMLRWIGRLCRIPAGCESILAVGFLGGYPVGAANISNAYESGQLTQSNARRLAIFCNNAGPSFLFGIIGPVFANLRYIWLLWLIHMASAIITGILLPGGSGGIAQIPPGKAVTLPDALNRAIRNIASVCGWVILFRMILEFLDRWIFWLLPEPFQVLLTGLLELSNGCLRLQLVESESIRFLLASFMLSFGGICVCLQTKSVYPDLNLKQYVAGKSLQCIISTVLSAVTLHMLRYEFGTVLSVGIIFAVVILMHSVWFLGKNKKEVAFQ